MLINTLTSGSTDLKTQCIHHEDMQLVNVTRHVTKNI